MSGDNPPSVMSTACEVVGSCFLYSIDLDRRYSVGAVNGLDLKLRWSGAGSRHLWTGCEQRGELTVRRLRAKEHATPPIGATFGSTGSLGIR
jgi:hypothetical protein